MKQFFCDREKAARAISGVKYLVRAGIDKSLIKESLLSTYINAKVLWQKMSFVRKSDMVAQGARKTIGDDCETEKPMVMW